MDRQKLISKGQRREVPQNLGRKEVEIDHTLCGRITSIF